MAETRWFALFGALAVFVLLAMLAGAALPWLLSRRRGGAAA
jgi:hypothetical protein